MHASLRRPLWVLALVLFLSLTAVPGPAAFAGTRIHRAPVSPAFRAYVRQMKALKADRSSHSQAARSRHKLGLVPDVVKLPPFKGIVSARAARDFPAAFDLRAAGSPALNYVTSVKNQNPYGTCWAFGSLASLESSFMPGVNWDFSEDNVARAGGFDPDPYTAGGNQYMATAELARSGPVTEADDPYGDSITPAGLAPRARLGSMEIVINDPDTAAHMARTAAVISADVLAVKTALYQHPIALYTSIMWSDAAYNSSTAAYYGGSAYYLGAGGHAPTIVGWNDAYSRSNFATTPPGDGAWIVKNSWGTAWGQQGYFYLSYYDYWAERYAVRFTGLPVGAYTTTYQYDPYGRCTVFSYTQNASSWAANDFTATTSERLTNVGFYTERPATGYTISTSTAHDGTQTQVATGTATYPGYHVVTLTTPKDLTAGQTFSVILKLTPASGSWADVVEECAKANYSSHAAIVAGKSWVSPTGTGSWTDASTGSYACNVCIKAFTRPGTTDSTPPVTSAAGVPAGGIWSTSPVTVDFSATDSGWGVLYTQAGVDGATPGQCSSIVISGDGRHTLSYSSVDKAGNAETPRMAAVDIDTAAPTTTIEGLPIGYWTNSATLVLVAQDATSGVARAEYRLAGASTWTQYLGPVALTRQGASTWEFRSTDNAGNVEATKTVTVELDSKGPTTTAYAARVKKGRTVVVRFKVSDPIPGCGSVHATVTILKGKRVRHTIKVRKAVPNRICKAPWKCTLKPGKYTIKVTATDGAGNKQVKIRTATLKVRRR